MIERELRDPLFKGCTRPAMVFGVPLTPLAIISGTVILLAVWTSFFVAFLLLPIILVMRAITKSDDQQFRLLGLKLMFRGINLSVFKRLFHCNQNGKFWNASAYSPIPFQKRK